MGRSSLAGVAALALFCSAVAGCSTDSGSEGPASAAPAGQQAPEEPAVPPVKIKTNVGRKNVAVDANLKLSATGGSLRKVAVTSSAGQLPGHLTKGDEGWVATARLEPGLAYQVRTVAERSDGKRVVDTSTFHTDNLTLDEQTYPSVAPLQGETVGVGMPVIVTFDVPVTDKASFERHMSVSTAPEQPGAWHWLSDYEAHWRPKTYWQAGTDVSVDVDVNSVPAGNGIYGQESRHVDFTIGDAHIYKVNMDTHQMRVFSNGTLLRTIPVTTGEEPKYTTRSGVKVIVEKYRAKRMNSETVGIDPNGPEGYNIGHVEYAMRVTYSGEFVHAAPWSVADQGVANVSHGCTGMSTANAGWLYRMTLRGDVVEYTGTNRPMEFANGYGDWNESFAEYKAGSALS